MVFFRRLMHALRPQPLVATCNVRHCYRREHLSLSRLEGPQRHAWKEHASTDGTRASAAARRAHRQCLRRENTAYEQAFGRIQEADIASFARLNSLVAGTN